MENEQNYKTTQTIHDQDKAYSPPYLSNTD